CSLLQMKRVIVTSLLLAVGTMAATAQYKTPPANTNQVAAPKAGQPAAAPGKTNAPATAASTVSTNKPDIKDLLQLDSFTNSSKMVFVKLGGGLWAGKYDVTQDEYQEIMKSNPSKFPGGRNPVENICYNDAIAFCDRLNE